MSSTSRVRAPFIHSCLGALLSVLPQASAQTQAVPTVAASSNAAHPSASFKQLMSDVQAGDYYPRYPAIPQWLDDGQRYTLLEPAAPPARGFDIVAYDTVTGSDRKVLVSANEPDPEGRTGASAV